MTILQQARRCIASDPPPAELLSSWLAVKAYVPATKARGRSGPNAAMAATETRFTMDNTGFLLQTLTSLSNMFASTQTSVVSTSLAVPTAATPHRISPPPPAVETDLGIYIQAFAASRNLPADIINSAWTRLSECDYSLGAICEASPGRLKEINALSEGQVLALKKFAREWCSKIEAKRAKRAM